MTSQQSHNCNNIPPILHTNTRKEVQSFNKDEKIWRRFPLISQFGKSNIQNRNGKERPSISLFSFKNGGMSCNRELFSQSPQDVLYNTDSPEHFFDWGILEFVYGDISKLNTADITFAIVHKPTPCMYPHIEILCNKYSEEANEIIPDELKIQVRQKLQSISEIIKK